MYDCANAEYGKYRYCTGYLTNYYLSLNSKLFTDEMVRSSDQLLVVSWLVARTHPKVRELSLQSWIERRPIEQSKPRRSE